MAVVPAHHCSHHLAVDFCHQKQTDVVIQLTFNIHFRIVPRTQQIAALPKGDHLFEIFLAKNAYLHGINRLFGFKNSDYGVNIAFSQ